MVASVHRSVQPLVLHQLPSLAHDQAKEEDRKGEANGRGIQHLAVVVLCGVRVDVLAGLGALPPCGEGRQGSCHGETSGQSGRL